MRAVFAQIADDASSSLRGKLYRLGTVLLGINVAAWAWALLTFHAASVQIGTAALAYTLGLRHAVDADHIAAIDNVTRKLMQEGRRPVAVGFFFSLGHSSVVVLASVAIALTATAFAGRLESVRDVGGVVGTLVSATFLLAIAAMNVFVLVAVVRTYRRVKAGGPPADEDLNLLLSSGGLLARIFRPMFRLITQSWQIYPLGFLFGLGFDTATEIGLLGISAAGATQGLSIWSILVFPALFTAGMSLVDTADSVLMLGTYGWAFAKPMRKLHYNITITSVSALVALVVGGLETLNLIGDRLALEGAFWRAVGGLNDAFGILGTLIVGFFVAAWAIAVLIHRMKSDDALDGAASR